MQFSGKDIILYPTDTVYGLGVDATDAEAVRALKDLKGRTGEEAKKPISIVVTDMAMAGEYAIVTPLAQQLADKFLPGKLSIVLTAKSNLPAELTAGTDTVAIRIPNHPIPLQLVRDLGRPITATSANIAGMPTLHSVPEILKQFGERASMISTRLFRSDGYHASAETELPEHASSTVVDARGDTPVIIREGAIPAEDIFSA